MPPDPAAHDNQGAVYVFDLAPGAWSDQGGALAGASGAPLLTASGTLAAGSPGSLDLFHAAPSAEAGLFVALSSAPVPFAGGTLQPFPFLGPTLHLTSTDGIFPIAFTMPGGVAPGTELWAQWAVVDAGAPQGIALSNALCGLTP